MPVNVVGTLCPEKRSWMAPEPSVRQVRNTNRQSAEINDPLETRVSIVEASSCTALGYRVKRTSNMPRDEFRDTFKTEARNALECTLTVLSV